MSANLLTINLNNLLYNITMIKQKTNKKVMAVLKSNAYNLNSRIILKYLLKMGIDFIVFNHYEEYLECFDLLENKKVLILETVEEKYLKKVPFNVRLSINDVTYIEKLKSLNKNIKVHIQVDTAMNRDGIKTIDELDEILKSTKDSLIEIEGIYTHFISDKNDYFYYNKQKDMFLTFVNHHSFEIVHSAATSSLAKDLVGNYVRVGIGMYGYHTALDLKSVVSAYTKVMTTRDSKKDGTIGYSALYISPVDEKIAVLPVGYYEGFSGQFVYKNKKPFPVVGKICMNHTFVLVDDTIKNNSWLNIFPIDDKINNNKDVNYYHTITAYRNFKRIYIMEYSNDIRKIFKERNKKSFKLRQRTRSH